MGLLDEKKKERSFFGLFGPPENAPHPHEVFGKPPAAVSWYLRGVMNQLMGGRPMTFTEDDLSPEELDAVRAAAQRAEDGVFGYGDFPTKEKWWKDRGSLLGEVDRVFTDPAASAQFALGMAKVKDGIVEDQYNFAAPPEHDISAKDLLELLRSGPRGPLNFIGNLVGLRNNVGPEVRINTKK